jgi:hypothetical protein
MGFKEKIAVFGNVDLVDALSFISLVGFDQSGSDRVPADILLGGWVEHLGGIAAKNRGAAGAICQFAKQGVAELSVLFAVQLHRGEANMFYGFAHLVCRFIDEDADFFDVRRQLRHDCVRGFRGDVARTLGMKNEAERIRSRIGGGERVVEVRHSANLDPRHKGSFELRDASSELSRSA